MTEQASCSAAKEFCARINVSRETFSKLETYEALLREQQDKMNLVAPSTLPQIWTRHFLDSAQLFELLPDPDQPLVDLGSGAGFPALVLAIMGVKRVHCVESVKKKAAFLQKAAIALALPVTVHAERAEAMRFKAGVVTARALAPLPDLLRLAHPFCRRDTVLLLPKGQRVEEELTKAAQSWHFNAERFQSQSDPSGVVLRLSQLEPTSARSGQRGARVRR